MPLKRRYGGEDRMYFKRLEIHGFKSFADPVTINFDRGITCVVGPNGSGKSNICDAIRWVLGAQSARALRGEKMEDVIFAGTAQRHARGMAEVTLVLDNEDQSLAIEYSEVAITRRMYRSGESEYLINNSRCRMKDIRELIMDTGIGVEGYSIIGQGKISDIISSNTESIREILEETAGIVMYRSKKEEAERKLASADANMERLGDIIGELESRLEDAMEENRPVIALQIREAAALDTFADCQHMIGKPLCLVCEDAGLLEQALRLYQGRALYEGALPEAKLQPLAEQYGLIY